MTSASFNHQRVRRPVGGRKARQPPPLQVFDAFNNKYHALWPLVEAARRDPQRYFGIPGWASWCRLPVNVAMGILQSQMPDHISSHEADFMYSTTAQLFATLAGWRDDQSAYSLAPEVLAEALAAPLPDRLPLEALLRMPHPTVYIETPGLNWFPGMPVVGFFASIDDRAAGGHAHPPELIVVALIDARRSDQRYHLPLARSLQVTQFMEIKTGTGRLPEIVPVSYPLALSQASFLEYEEVVRLGKARDLDAMGERPDVAEFFRSAQGQAVSIEVLEKVLRLTNILSYVCTVYGLATGEPSLRTQ